MVTTVKFQATSCFHRVLWQITIFLLFKLSRNQENSCQGYVLCKDIFVTSRSTRGPLRQLFIEIDIEVEVDTPAADGFKQGRRENRPSMTSGRTPDTLDINPTLVRESAP